MYMTLDERSTIAAVRRGDTAAFASLVEAYQGPVFNLAYRLTGSRPDAEDLTQEAFLKAFASLDGFREDRRFFSWLFTIALNLTRNHLKKNRRGVGEAAGPPDGRSVEDRAADGEAEGAEELLVRRSELDRLDAALAVLPLEQREAVVLRYYQGLPFEEVAEIAGVSSGAARMRVQRALESLRKIMSESEDEQA